MSSDEPHYPESGDDFYWDLLDEPIPPEDPRPDPAEELAEQEYRRYLYHERLYKKQLARERRWERHQARLRARQRLPWIFWPLFLILVAMGNC